MEYVIEITVRLEIVADSLAAAWEVAREKSVELADLAGDVGAFETEATAVIHDGKTRGQAMKSPSTNASSGPMARGHFATD